MSLSQKHSFPVPQEGERDNCIPRFFLMPVLDQDATKVAGHPVFKDVEYVEIIIPKTKDFRPVYQVSAEYKKRWPQQYAQFQQSLSATPDGFRLDEWSMMPRSIAETLKSLQIYTMEQFVLIPEDDLKILGPGIPDLQKHAREVLDNRDEKQEQIDKLQGQNQDLLARLERLERQTASAGPATPRRKKKRVLSDKQKAALEKARLARMEKRGELAAVE